MIERPGRTSGEGIGEPSFISTISKNRDLLQGVREGYSLMNVPPDYTAVIDAPEVRQLIAKLTPEEHASLRDAVRKEFDFDIAAAAAGAASGTPDEERRDEAEDDPASVLRGQLQTVRELFSQDSVPLQENAVYREQLQSVLQNFWNSDAFKTLAPDAQQQLKTEFEPVAASAETVPAPSQRSEMPPSHERKERERKPVKYVFNGYRLSRTGDEWTMEEDTDVWNKSAQRYEKKDPKTAIAIPEKIRAIIDADPGAAKELTDECARLRRKLDARGVKIFFDGIKDLKTEADPEKRGRLYGDLAQDPDKTRPKWKYFLEQWSDDDKERLPASFFPPRIITLVLDAPGTYHQTDEWNTWFGPAMQKKREEVITPLLAAWAEKRAARTEGSATKAAETPERGGSVRAAEVKKEKEAVSEDQETVRARKELSAIAARSFVDDGVRWAQRFDDPTERPEAFLDTIARRVVSNLQLYYGERNVPDAARLAEREMSDEVADAVRERFAGTTPELVNALDGWLQKHAGRGGRSIELAETPGKDYETLRGELAAVFESGGDLSRFRQHLQRRGSVADAGLKKAIQQLVIDIEHGAAGPATESSLDGLERSGAELEFLKAHPGLNARNFEVTDWRDPFRPKVVIHLDRLDPNGSAARAVSRLVADAAPDLSSDLAAVVTDYVYGLLAERSGGRPLSVAFQTDIARVDPEAREVVVADLPRLQGIIKRAGDEYAMRKIKKGNGGGPRPNKKNS